MNVWVCSLFSHMSSDKWHLSAGREWHGLAYFSNLRMTPNFKRCKETYRLLKKLGLREVKGTFLGPIRVTGRAIMKAQIPYVLPNHGWRRKNQEMIIRPKHLSLPPFPTSPAPRMVRLWYSFSISCMLSNHLNIKLTFKRNLPSSPGIILISFCSAEQFFYFFMILS